MGDVRQVLGAILARADVSEHLGVQTARAEEHIGVFIAQMWAANGPHSCGVCAIIPIMSGIMAQTVEDTGGF